MAAQWDHPELSSIYGWFKNCLAGLNLSSEDGGLSTKYSASISKKDPLTRNWIADILKRADTGIEDYRVEGKRVQKEALAKADLPKEVRDLLHSQSIPNEMDGIFYDVVYFSHRNDGDEYVREFLLAQESAGTRRLFALLGPLKETLDTGTTLFIDELESSLHPHLAREIVKLFHSENENRSGAQLIFATHDATLLSQDIMRRDQVWMMEKNRDGCTQLYPLTDYKPRKDESLMRGYLAGRYGGIPFMPSFVDE